MKTEGSLPCSQDPTIGPYSEPDASSPHVRRPISQRSILILSYLRLGLQGGIIPSGFQTEILYAFLISCVLYSPPIGFSLIWSP